MHIPSPHKKTAMPTRRRGSLLLACGLHLWLSACLTMGPTNKQIRQSQALYRLGVKSSNQGQYRQALATLLRAAELNPYDYWIQEAIGGTLLRMGKPKMALKHYKKALELQPKSPRGWNNLGSVYMTLGQWKKAVHAFEKSLQNILYQTPCFSQMNLGWAHHKLKHYELAQKYLALATQTCPKLCMGYRLYGIAMYEQKSFGDAQKNFEKLTHLCKEFANGYYWLARSFIAQKHFHAALPPLRQCIRRSPAHATRLRHACQTLLATTRRQIANQD